MKKFVFLVVLGVLLFITSYCQSQTTDEIIEVYGVRMKKAILGEHEIETPARQARKLLSDRHIQYLEENIELLVVPEREEEERLYRIMIELRQRVARLQKLLEKLQIVARILSEELNILRLIQELVVSLQDAETEAGVTKLVKMLTDRVLLDIDINNQNIQITSAALEKAIKDLGEAEANYYRDYDMRMRILNTADEAKLRGRRADNHRLYLKNVIYNSAETTIGKPICTMCDPRSYTCSTNSTAIIYFDDATGCGSCQCRPTFAFDPIVPPIGIWPTGEPIIVESSNHMLRSDWDILNEIKRLRSESISPQPQAAASPAAPELTPMEKAIAELEANDAQPAAA